eukprot:9624255-Lingulodinium_polyedra.AAC.1
MVRAWRAQTCDARGQRRGQTCFVGRCLRAACVLVSCCFRGACALLGYYLGAPLLALLACGCLNGAWA